MRSIFRSDFSNSSLVGSPANISAGAYNLNGTYLQVPSDAAYSAQRQFEVSLDFQTTAGGNLFQMPGAFEITINPKGQLVFKLFANAAGERGTIVAPGIDPTDGNWHSIKLSYDADAGAMVAYVDGSDV